MSRESTKTGNSSRPRSRKRKTSYCCSSKRRIREALKKREKKGMSSKKMPPKEIRPVTENKKTITTC